MGRQEESPQSGRAMSTGRRAALWSAAALLLAAAPLGGCVNRAAGPGLPYVQPAVSLPNPNPDPATLHMSARLQDVELDMQRVRDAVERMQAHNDGGLEKTVGSLNERVSFIERQLGIDAAVPSAGMSAAQRPAQPLPSQSPPVEPPSSVTAKQPPTGMPPAGAPVEIVEPPASLEEKLYREAYATLKRGAADQAVELFEAFLKQNPASPLAPDAVYWIGEAKFSAGRFPEAVLQFDRVIKEFPGSRKELNALLKQGLAFEKMSDRRSARIIFQKLVQQNPHTSQARIAAARLKSLPDE
jgi:tol-pal system protein YbgF